ncbi:YcaO-like family protein [Rubrimonas cliftonensis]|uniref:YcaO-like family protein n=1 Tax=Rubrimonas cliftonensis TaxID=89524 RepID=A0A1H3VV08_9RHOB|nr:YcaO-like family protein [Rubrimonas cliftonensis]SDZ78609.1 YcaO-like family protein [Rubrimonas cliftonensis]
MPEHLPKDDPEALLRWAGEDDVDLRRLSTLAPRLDALFALPSPTAPLAVVVGAVFAGAGARFNAAGVGASRRAALGGCLGEAAETLAQCVAAKPRLRAPLGAAGIGLSVAEQAVCAARLSAMGLDPRAPLDWIDAEIDDAPALAPAALAIRTAPASPQAPRAGPPLSVGCAAGVTPTAALRAAALELFERHAMAGFRRHGACSFDADAAEAGAATLARLGRPAAAPPVALFRIDRDCHPLPVVAAFSELGEGAAAGETAAEAACAAARELVAAETGALFAARRGGLAPPRGLPAGAAWPGRRPGAFELGAALADLAHPVRRVTLEAPLGAATVVKLICFALDPG